MDLDFRTLAPLLVLAVALAAYALVDLVRAPAVRYLPQWAWALICVLSMPLGPLAYLALGRAPRRRRARRAPATRQRSSRPAVSARSTEA